MRHTKTLLEMTAVHLPLFSFFSQRVAVVCFSLSAEIFSCSLRKVSPLGGKNVYILSDPSGSNYHKTVSHTVGYHSDNRDQHVSSVRRCLLKTSVVANQYREVKCVCVGGRDETMEITVDSLFLEYQRR